MSAGKQPSESEEESEEEDYRIAELEEANARLMEENEKLRRALAEAARAPAPDS